MVITCVPLQAVPRHDATSAALRRDMGPMVSSFDNRTGASRQPVLRRSLFDTHRLPLLSPAVATPAIRWKCCSCREFLADLTGIAVWCGCKRGDAGHVAQPEKTPSPRHQPALALSCSLCACPTWRRRVCEFALRPGSRRAVWQN